MRGGRVSRREFIHLATAATGGIAAGVASREAVEAFVGGKRPSPTRPLSIPFYGSRQGGITPPQQGELHFASFDVTADRVEEVRELLRAWTEAAARMTVGSAEVSAPGA